MGLNVYPANVYLDILFVIEIKTKYRYGLTVIDSTNCKEVLSLVLIAFRQPLGRGKKGRAENR